MENGAENRTSTSMLTRQQVSDLANSWEPNASRSPVKFRKATCVECESEMEEMWHIWLNDGTFKKEIHMCRECGLKRGLVPGETYELS
jgi:hypothetical protein